MVSFGIQLLVQIKELVRIQRKNQTKQNSNGPVLHKLLAPVIMMVEL